MHQQAYMLVFQGDLVDGFDLDRVKQNIKELFKVSQEKVEQLFSLPAVVVKGTSPTNGAEIPDTTATARLITVIQPMAAGNVAQVAGREMGAADAAATAVSAPGKYGSREGTRRRARANAFSVRRQGR